MRVFRVIRGLRARKIFAEFSLARAQGPSGHPFEDALFRFRVRVSVRVRAKKKGKQATASPTSKRINGNCFAKFVCSAPCKVPKVQL